MPLCFISYRDLAALRYTPPENAYSESATRFINGVLNVRSIASHFKPKIEAWSSANQIISITPEQVKKSLWSRSCIKRSLWSRSGIYITKWTVIKKNKLFKQYIFCMTFDPHNGTYKIAVLNQCSQNLFLIVLS